MCSLDLLVRCVCLTCVFEMCSPEFCVWGVFVWLACLRCVCYTYTCLRCVYLTYMFNACLLDLRVWDACLGLCVWNAGEVRLWDVFAWLTCLRCVPRAVCLECRWGEILRWCRLHLLGGAEWVVWAELWQSHCQLLAHLGYWILLFFGRGHFLNRGTDISLKITLKISKNLHFKCWKVSQRNVIMSILNKLYESILTIKVQQNFYMTSRFREIELFDLMKTWP
jgi:hypothetical protein